MNKIEYYIYKKNKFVFILRILRPLTMPETTPYEMSVSSNPRPGQPGEHALPATSDTFPPTLNGSFLHLKEDLSSSSLWSAIQPDASHSIDPYNLTEDSHFYSLLNGSKADGSFLLFGNSTNNTSEYVPYNQRPETYIVPALFALIFIIGIIGKSCSSLTFSFFAC